MAFVALVLRVLVKNSASILAHPLKVIPASTKAVDTSVLKWLVVAKPMIELVKAQCLVPILTCFSPFID